MTLNCQPFFINDSIIASNLSDNQFSYVIANSFSTTWPAYARIDTNTSRPICEQEFGQRIDKERAKEGSQKELEVDEDKRMALGRLTAGWLFQIRQVRCFDAKKRHRSLATWRRGQRPLDEVRGGEHSWRWATAGDFAADLPKVLAVHLAVHSLCLMRRAAILLFVPRRYRQEFLSTPPRGSITRQPPRAGHRDWCAVVYIVHRAIIGTRAKNYTKLSISFCRYIEDKGLITNAYGFPSGPFFAGGFFDGQRECLTMRRINAFACSLRRLWYEIIPRLLFSC